MVRFGLHASWLEILEDVAKQKIGYLPIADALGNHTPLPDRGAVAFKLVDAARSIRCGRAQKPPPVNTFETGKCPRCKGTKFRIFSR
jgi:hypothetical protein